jgi:hypothetical protein
MTSEYRAGDRTWYLCPKCGEVVGQFRCANERCGKPLHADHVTLVTTAHVRRFCTVECITEGHEAWLDRILRESQ